MICVCLCVSVSFTAACVPFVWMCKCVRCVSRACSHVRVCARSPCVCVNVRVDMHARVRVN